MSEDTSGETFEGFLERGACLLEKLADEKGTMIGDNLFTIETLKEIREFNEEVECRVECQSNNGCSGDLKELRKYNKIYKKAFSEVLLGRYEKPYFRLISEEYGSSKEEVKRMELPYFPENF